MAKPSAKRVVLSHYPTAGVERHKPQWGPVYYLVRRRGEFLYDGQGATAVEAWNDAMVRLKLIGIKEQA